MRRSLRERKVCLTQHATLRPCISCTEPRHMSHMCCRVCVCCAASRRSRRNIAKQIVVPPCAACYWLLTARRVAACRSTSARTGSVMSARKLLAKVKTKARAKIVTAQVVMRSDGSCCDTAGITALEGGQEQKPVRVFIRAHVATWASGGRARHFRCLLARHAAQQRVLRDNLRELQWLRRCNISPRKACWCGDSTLRGEPA